MGCTRFFGKNLYKNYNQRDITHKLIKEGQLFLQATHCLDIIHIPIEFHEDISNSYRVMECTILKNTQNKHKKIK